MEKVEIAKAGGENKMPAEWQANEGEIASFSQSQMDESTAKRHLPRSHKGTKFHYQ
ncbi:MAG: hypothetical protein ABIL11_11740 [Chloroflexota bacterium]